MMKKADLVRARENLKHYDWAQEYLKGLKVKTAVWLPKISPQFLEEFIPETTPGATFSTPCPVCRDQKQPYLPHGIWAWTPERPNELLCKVCHTVFPNADYPENVKVETTWGRPQTFSYMGGETFEIFTYKHGRPSMTGNIRGRKTAWMTDLVRDMAEVYALTGDLSYAEAVKNILLRFADVYPYWLVHVGYGEYADMDPTIAAKHVTALPKDEAVYPPNIPDRDLHSGYWSAGRARSEGMEGIFVRAVASAYDLTRDAIRADGQPVYSLKERLLIEEHLLLESTKLLVADLAINNKSVGNRTAAGIVGMVVGEPDLVRFGMEGFQQTVTDWFLPDGGTPESPAYADMALYGIVDFSQALRGYSDPPGYIDDQGKRYDNFDPYQLPSFQKVWRGMYNSLQGDLKYPPFGDSYEESKMSASYAELMADNYPDHPEYLALLKAALDGDWSRPYAPYAIYYAQPGRENETIPPLDFPSYCFPDLRVGFMRTGTDGRESLLLLSASHWGMHHHLDSLNLYYWKQGNELLSDLGYLWDHPDMLQTVRTLAHNTVLIDEKDQTDNERGGTVEYFVNEPRVKAMRASSQAYAEANRYERAATLIDHGASRSYVVDVFWAQGGRSQDYVYHGPNLDWELVEPESVKTDKNQNPGGEPKPSVTWTPSQESIYDLKTVKSLPNPGQQIYGLRWQMPNLQDWVVWNVPQPSETAFVGKGWGQRDRNNSDRGAELPYIVRRTAGSGERTFVSVMEAHPKGQPFVKRIIPLNVEGNLLGVTALQIDTREGRDYVVVSLKPEARKIPTPDGILETNALLSVLSVQDGQVTFRAVEGGEMDLKPAKSRISP